MEFRDLKQQYQHLKSDIDQHIAEVISSASFISGKPVSELEQMLADYVGVKHCISCANGTDAISIALWAWGIGRNDAVFVPDFTFFSSGECPATAGATPIFVDVLPSTYNLDPVKLEKAIKKVLCEGKYTPKAVIAVDLFGLPADYDRIRPICEKYNLLLLEDAAQGFGGILRSLTLSLREAAASSSQSAAILGENSRICASSRVVFRPAASAVTTMSFCSRTISRVWVPMDPVDPSIAIFFIKTSILHPHIIVIL